MENRITCPVCKKGAILPSKKKSTRSNIKHLRCMRGACQAKFNQEIKGKITILRRVA